jgi:hypothetical protein
MVDPLVGIHAGIGELGIFAFIWVFVEIISPTKERLKRAKKAAMIGVILLFASWLTGGFYYVTVYGSEVKPIIKEGPQPWAHLVFTETKEHIFIFLPFLAVLSYGLLIEYEKEILRNRKIRKSIIILVGLIILMGLSMAGMGYIISTGARSALEVATP